MTEATIPDELEPTDPNAVHARSDPGIGAPTLCGQGECPAAERAIITCRRCRAIMIADGLDTRVMDTWAERGDAFAAQPASEIVPIDEVLAIIRSSDAPPVRFTALLELGEWEVQPDNLGAKMRWTGVGEWWANRAAMVRFDPTSEDPETSWVWGAGGPFQPHLRSGEGRAATLGDGQTKARAWLIEWANAARHASAVGRSAAAADDAGDPLANRIDQVWQAAQDAERYTWKERSGCESPMALRTELNRLRTIVNEARAEGFKAGVEASARIVQGHSCVASCCEAQPSGTVAAELAWCVRKNAGEPRELSEGSR